jgi:hypothetical protein
MKAGRKRRGLSPKTSNLLVEIIFPSANMQILEATVWFGFFPAFSDQLATSVRA